MKRFFQIHRPTKRILILSVVLLLAVGLTVGTVAKYVREQQHKNILAGEAFYFTVDHLGNTNTESSLHKTVELFGGGTHVLPFAVQNFFDELRVTSADVSYTVALDPSSTYGGASLDKNAAGYTLAGGSAREESFVLTVNAGYDEGDTVVVRVASSVPYEKEMTLTFLLHKYESAVSYRVVDGPVASLIVMTNVALAKGDLVIDWSGVKTTGGVSQNTQNIFQVDTTSPYIADDVGGVLEFVTNPLAGGYLKSATVTQALEPGESILIYFFKIDATADYSVETTPATLVDGVYRITLTGGEGGE